jgi:hypothetical protein
MENLRKKSVGAQSKWSMDQIKAGLEHFKDLNGRYPSSREIDNFDYLPSARSIQRTHKGLVNLRTSLGFDESMVNQTKGTIRSNKAKSTYANSVDHELEFYNYLISKIPEVRVHEHKILRPGHVCCDFFIYTSNTKGFAIDIFYAQDLFTLQRIIPIKLKRYRGLRCKVYFVLVGNDSIFQEEIDKMLNNRKTKLPEHIEVITEKVFKARESLTQ